MKFANYVNNLPQIIIEKLNKYKEMLMRESINQSLVAVSTLSDIEHWHFLDGLQIASYVEDQNIKGVDIYDIGAGAGIPGIVLAIYSQGVRDKNIIHLVEPRRKRCAFLEKVISELSLANVILHRCKASNLNVVPKYIVERGVGTLDWLRAHVPHNDKTLWMTQKGPHAMGYKAIIAHAKRWRDPNGQFICCTL